MGKAEDAYEWGRMRMADDDNLYAWKNSVIAEVDGNVAGSANGYVVPAANPDEEKSNPDQFLPVFQLFQQAVGDWLVDCLAVYSTERGKGVGAALLDDCFDRARQSGARQISLVAEDSNHAALSLYRSRGFMQRAQRPYVPFNKKSETKYWLLLSAPLTQGESHG